MGVSEPNEPARPDPADLGFPPVQADPQPADPTPTPGVESAPATDTTSEPGPESQPEPSAPTESPVPSSPAEDPPASEPAQEPAPAEPQPDVPPDPAASQPVPDVAAALENPEPTVPGPGDPGPATTQALPVRVDNMSRRSDNDALEGLFCDIVSGPYEGRIGVFDRVLEFDRQTGYPKRILVITRDADNLMLDVAYEDARPSSSTGSR